MRYKISIVGSAGCGKTTLVNYLAHGRPYLDVDKDTDIHSMNLHINDETVGIRLWDTMKGEYMGNISSLAHKNAIICLVLFDFLSRQSFAMASQYAQKVLMFEPNLSIIFVATKCDQAEINQKIAVTHEEARAFAALYDAPIVFTCGLKGIGVNQLLNEIITILTNKMFTPAKSILSLEDLEVAPTPSKCYC